MSFVDAAFAHAMRDAARGLINDPRPRPFNKRTFLRNAKWLYDALAASPDDAQRAALIDAAPRDVRDALAALMAYRSLVAPIRNDALDAFKHALSTATDDAARLALINAADVPVVAAFRDELWWQTASAEDAQRRYTAIIDDQT